MRFPEKLASVPIWIRRSLRRRPAPGSLAAAAVVLLVLLRTLMPANISNTSRGNPEVCLVKHVLDGDTIELADGRRVRLEGIDAPEIAGPNRAAQAWSWESAAWLRRQIQSQKVQLEFTGRDHYGRYLAWIYTQNSELLNLQSLSLGMSRLLDEYGLPGDLEPSLRQAESEARLRRLGIWQKARRSSPAPPVPEPENRT